jgi:hypothetical protein
MKEEDARGIAPGQGHAQIVDKEVVTITEEAAAHMAAQETAAARVAEWEQAARVEAEKKQARIVAEREAASAAAEEKAAEEKAAAAAAAAAAVRAEAEEVEAATRIATEKEEAAREAAEQEHARIVAEREVARAAAEEKAAEEKAAAAAAAAAARAEAEEVEGVLNVLGVRRILAEQEVALTEPEQAGACVASEDSARAEAEAVGRIASEKKQTVCAVHDGCHGDEVVEASDTDDASVSCELDQVRANPSVRVAQHGHNGGGEDEFSAITVHYSATDGPCEEPVTLRVLATKLALAEIEWDTLVWSRGMGEWAKLEDCLGHEAWGEQLEEYFDELIEEAAPDEEAAHSTAVAKKAAKHQVKEQTAEKNGCEAGPPSTLTAEPGLQHMSQNTSPAEGMVEAKQESTTALTHELSWT